MSFRTRVEADKAKMQDAKRPLSDAGNRSPSEAQRAGRRVVPRPTPGDKHARRSLGHGPATSDSPGARRTGNPWRFAVNPVSVDCLTEADIAAVDQGLHLTGLEKTDPPWPDVVASVNAAHPPFHIVHQGLREPGRPPQIPDPDSPAALCHNLFYFRTASPPPSYSGLLRYHSLFRQHHSTRSFNLLIALGIRMTQHGTVERLLTLMRAEGVPPDSLTRQLIVRNSILGDEGWDVAWQKQTERARSQGVSMPLHIWLEFLASLHKDISWPPPATRRKRPSGLRTTIPLLTRKTRLQTLMENMPSVTATEWAQIPPRFVCQLVRALLHSGHRSKAVDVTLFFLRHLPVKVTPRLASACRSILYYHLMCRHRPGLREFYALKEEFLQFFRACPVMRPDSTILFGLMRPLKRAVRCGDIALELVQQFVSRWGPDIVDDKVRRRLASLAIKQGRLRVANIAIRSQKAVNDLRKELVAEEELKSCARGFGSGQTPRLREALRYERRNVESWKWRMVRKRWWRVRLRRDAYASGRRP